MRTVATIPHSQMMITLFLWNNKYLVKFEAGPYEQVYKVAETDVVSEEDLKARVSDQEFLDKIVERFRSMNADFGNVLAAPKPGG